MVQPFVGSSNWQLDVQQSLVISTNELSEVLNTVNVLSHCAPSTNWHVTVQHVPPSHSSPSSTTELPHVPPTDLKQLPVKYVPPSSPVLIASHMESKFV
jgi:hypothetical protein